VLVISLYQAVDGGDWESIVPSREFPVPIALILVAAAPPRLSASPPTPNHVVIVVEENHSFEQVIGSPQAPYINQLAASGALMTNFFAITHPSQPNYLHLFSGSNQGVTSNSFPAGVPFSTLNLGAALLAAGRTFAGYCEDLPKVGSNVETYLNYARKHNPWVNWQADPAGPNQLPPATNRPFFSPPPGSSPFFGDCDPPGDYSGLPTVTFVVPNLQNDMHDGTIAQGDAWLQTWIGPYATWAQSHNSLLIVTFDEDNSAARNRIPTIFYGPMIRPGAVNVTCTLHNLLRTVEEMYGCAHSGSAAKVRRIIGPFAGDPATITRRFQHGAGGYMDAHDTYIEAANPNATHGSSTPIVVDGSPLSQGLIRFDNIFGYGSQQIPPNATIYSAKLAILTGLSGASGDSSSSTMSVHAMLIPWSETSTWNSLANGVSADDIEAAASSDFAAIPNVLDAWVIFDVSDTIQGWANAREPAAANRGWAIIPGGTDGWRSASSEFATVADRPFLEVTFRTPCFSDIDHNWTVNIDDLFAVIENWNMSGPNAADVDHNGIVNIDDLFAVIAAWGPCPIR
jgi:hypothetical protein